MNSFVSQYIIRIPKCTEAICRSARRRGRRPRRPVRNGVGFAQSPANSIAPTVGRPPVGRRKQAMKRRGTGPRPTSGFERHFVGGGILDVPAGRTGLRRLSGESAPHRRRGGYHPPADAACAPKETCRGDLRSPAQNNDGLPPSSGELCTTSLPARRATHRSPLQLVLMPANSPKKRLSFSPVLRGRMPSAPTGIHRTNCRGRRPRRPVHAGATRPTAFERLRTSHSSANCNPSETHPTTNYQLPTINSIKKGAAAAAPFFDLIA